MQYYRGREKSVKKLLRKLDLGYTLHSSEIDALSCIETITFTKGIDEDIPNSICNLTNLKLLRIEGEFDWLPKSIGKLTSLQKLYLNFTYIDKLPDSIGNLYSLQVLDISNNPIKNLPSSISNLESLEIFDMSKTHISRLPDEICFLRCLRSISAYDSYLSELPNDIGNLSQLVELNLSYSDITILPTSIGNLKELRTLRISHTILDELPQSFYGLIKLIELDLSYTRIDVLKPDVSNFSNLDILSLHHTELKEIPQSITGLTELRVLLLNNTLIEQFPQFSNCFKELEILDISHTSIRELPERGWGNLKLRHLNLAGLTIEKIPKELALYGLIFVEERMPDFGINLAGTKIVSQNKSIFINSPSLIPDLYDRQQVETRECKVIFLGDGDSGKSYTICRLHNHGEKEGEKVIYNTRETPGVEITDYHVDEYGGFTIHFWDFGGQELLHSMHRCFLTEKTCYVVTIKSRETKGDKRAIYWLRNIAAFAPESPVILYVNCWDNDDGRRVIDEPRILNDFPNVKCVVYCSAKEASRTLFTKRITNRIINTIVESEYINTKVPSKWDRVRQIIQDKAKEQHYLTKKEYHTICKENGIENEQNSDLLTFFNNTGVCFSYHRDNRKKELSEYKLLDPKWLTNAIYAIIEEGSIFSQQGKLNVVAVKKLLCTKRTVEKLRRIDSEIFYKDEECAYIIDVAAAHDLCFRLSDEDKLFFPALCTKNSPKDALRELKSFPIINDYCFKYKYLPDSVIHRLMIYCMRMDLLVKSCWLKGMVIGSQNRYKVIIRMDDDDNLCVRIYSKLDYQACNLFDSIREGILEVNKCLNLEAREYIIVGNDSFPLERVIKSYKDEEEISGNETGQKYNPFDLLSHYFRTEFIYNIDISETEIVLSKPFNMFDKKLSYVRQAIIEAYGYKCQYCNRLCDPSDLDIDHILPSSYEKIKDLCEGRVKAYVDELKQKGFNTNKPDYIENYLPACRNCNVKKGNKIYELSALYYYHLKALEKRPTVLRLIEKYKEVVSGNRNEIIT